VIPTSYHMKSFINKKLCWFLHCVKLASLELYPTCNQLLYNSNLESQHILGYVHVLGRKRSILFHVLGRWFARVSNLREGISTHGKVRLLKICQCLTLDNSLGVGCSWNKHPFGPYVTYKIQGITKNIKDFISVGRFFNFSTFMIRL
jgi:hypothetical protein